MRVWEPVEQTVVWEEVDQKKKSRPISYACHKDSLLFKFYREKLYPIYESRLQQDGISESVVAYRRIPKANGNGNKSNIEIANDAFEKISELATCCTVAMDISDYFGSIDHSQLFNEVKEILSLDKLPNDWRKLLKNLTKFRFIELDEALLYLGYAERGRKGRLRYTRRPRRIPKRLCTLEQYRGMVEADLIEAERDDAGNYKTCGIPQGTPISDILANLYLRKIDILLRDYALKKGGFYFRYSDDLMLIFPGDGRAARNAETYVKRSLSEYDKGLKVNRKKTEIAVFKDGVASYTLHNVKGSKRRVRNNSTPGASYLGFKFDGKYVYLRNSTVTNLRRKVNFRSRKHARTYFKRYSEKPTEWLLTNYDDADLKAKFLQMRRDKPKPQASDEDEDSQDDIERNFYSYLKRAEGAFPKFETRFRKQVAWVKPYSIECAYDRLNNLIMKRDQ